MLLPVLTKKRKKQNVSIITFLIRLCNIFCMLYRFNKKCFPSTVCAAMHILHLH